VCPYTDATQSGVVMSSFAFRKPVVASNVGGLSEYIEDDKSGRLIESGSAAALEGAIHALLDDREKLRGMERYIQETYFDGKYSWDRIAGELRGVYEGMGERRGREGGSRS